MPLTTTSGYTFPTPGVPTTQWPTSGTNATAEPTAKKAAETPPQPDPDKDLAGYLRWKATYGTDSDYDRWMNFLENNYSIDKANQWTAEREDTQYQRLVADLKAVGINPYSLLQNGGNPVSSSSATSSYSGSYSSNEALKQEANSQKWLSLLTTVITTMVIAAAMMA